MSRTRNNFSRKVRERAVRMVWNHEHEHPFTSKAPSAIRLGRGGRTFRALVAGGRPDAVGLLDRLRQFRSIPPHVVHRA